MSTELRIKALDFASTAGGHHEEVVARAAAYYAFLTNTTVDVAAPSTKTTTVKDKSPDEAKEEPKVVEQEAANETTEGEAPAVDYSEVKRCILGISSKLGRDVATKLLGEFGVEKGPDLKPADYAAFVAKAEPLLAGA